MCALATSARALRSFVRLYSVCGTGRLCPSRSVTSGAASASVSGGDEILEGAPWRAVLANGPVPIQSYTNSRVVACAGLPSRPPHDLEFFVVTKGELRECPSCRQVFKLESK